MVKVKMSGCDLHALVDTGACRSLISKRAWKLLCKVDHRPLMLKKGLTLISISDNTIPTLGRTSLKLYSSNIEFHVVENLKHDLLLGADAIRRLRGGLDFETNSVRLNNIEHHMLNPQTGDTFVYEVKAPIDFWQNKFPNLFAQHEWDIGRLKDNKYEMVINTGQHLPIRQRAYRIPLLKRKVVEEMLEEMIKAGVIEESQSPWASPITLQKKPDGKWRFAVDLRKVNAVTKKDAYPIPNINDVLDSMGGAKVFSTLDLKQGFWNIPVAEDSKEKTAFITHKGLFQFKTMPYGACNSSAVFQRTMNMVLAKYIGDFVQVFVDDIIVFSKDEQEHQKHLQLVFQALQDAGFKLKMSKCHINVPEVKLLGFIVDKNGRRSDPKKTEAIRNMAPPKNVSEIRSLLGMANYHRSHVRNFAEIVYPLVKLTKKNAHFVWGDEQKEAFEKIKDALTSNEVMIHPEIDKPYSLYTDASGYSVGAILCQEKDGVERPVMYLSKQLTAPQMKYSTIEREAYSVVYALKTLRPYLYGAEFTIYTDHKPLKSLFLQEQKNSRLQRWAVLLAEYGAPIEYRKGSHNQRADFLSRLRNPSVDNSDIFDGVGAGEIYTFVEEMDDIPWEFDELEKEAIRQEQKEMPEYELGLIQEDDYVIHDGLLYTIAPPPGKPSYPRLVLPLSARFRVIRRAHTEVGHQGMRKTLDRLQEAYKWPFQRRDVMKVLGKCAKCNVNRRRRDHPPPTSMPLALYPGQIMGMDLSGPYPPSKNNNKYILSIIDHCTGFVEVKCLPDKTAEGVLEFLENEFFPRHSLFEKVISDNGLEFCAKIVKGYLEALGCEVINTTFEHPQSNAKVERWHRSLKEMLTKLVNARPGDWEQCLGPALWAHRISTSSVTGYSPFFLQYGRKPNMPGKKIMNRKEGTSKDVLAERLDTLSRAFKEAANKTLENRAYNEERLRKKAHTGNLEVGDHVAILVSNPGCLEPKRDHGYVVTGIRGAVIKVIGPRNKRRTVNRDKVVAVDPDSDWDTLQPRLTRTEKRREKDAQEAATETAARLLPYVPRNRRQQQVANEGTGASVAIQHRATEVQTNLPQSAQEVSSGESDMEVETTRQVDLRARGKRKSADTADETFVPPKWYRGEEHTYINQANNCWNGRLRSRVKPTTSS